MRRVDCPYCGDQATLTDGARVYPHRPDLHHRVFWACFKCGAWVGCHEGSRTHAPLGRLANAKLRYHKSEAHRHFDPLWRHKMEREGCSKRQARKAAYAWLAEQLGIPKEECHIGMFGVPQCREVVRVCRPWLARLRP